MAQISQLWFRGTLSKSVGVGGFVLAKVMLVRISEEGLEVNQAKNGGRSISGKSINKCSLAEGGVVSRRNQIWPMWMEWKELGGMNGR